MAHELVGQETKINCLKMFFIHYSIKTRKHIYAQHQHLDQGREHFQEPTDPLGPLPIINPPPPKVTTLLILTLYISFACV